MSTTIRQKFMLTVLRMEQNYYFLKNKKETTERLGQYIVNNFNKEEVYEYYKTVVEIDAKNLWDKLFYTESKEEVYSILEDVCNQYN